MLSFVTTRSLICSPPLGPRVQRLDGLEIAIRNGPHAIDSFRVVVVRRRARWRTIHTALLPLNKRKLEEVAFGLFAYVQDPKVMMEVWS
jgi:hypothetical protein